MLEGHSLASYNSLKIVHFLEHLSVRISGIGTGIFSGELSAFSIKRKQLGGNIMVYLYLFLAILAEVAATTSLKLSEQFTKSVPSAIVVVGYGVAFYLLSIVLKTMQVGIAYAIWTSIGIVLVTLLGLILFKQRPDAPAVVGILLIIAGVLSITLFSKSALSSH